MRNPVPNRRGFLPVVYETLDALMLSTDGMDHKGLTDAEADELFQRTQPISNAISALAQAEQIIADVGKKRS